MTPVLKSQFFGGGPVTAVVLLARYDPIFSRMRMRT